MAGRRRRQAAPARTKPSSHPSTHRSRQLARVARAEAEHARREDEYARRLDAALSSSSSSAQSDLQQPESKWGWAGWAAAPELLEVEIETRLAQSCRSKALDLSGLSLERVPSAVVEFGSLPTLQSISFAYNKLRELPEAFVQRCSELTTLQLEHNQIATLPASLPALTTLRVLNLEHNRLQGLSPALTQLPVLEQVLVSGNNGITSLPPNLNYAGDGVVTVRRRPALGTRLSLSPARPQLPDIGSGVRLHGCGRRTNASWLLLRSLPRIA